MADSHGVVVKYFHANNRIYAKKAFIDEVRDCGQTITYCGVGVHRQNGVGESHIARGSRTNLLHAQRRWPEAICEILWSFAWNNYERRYNDLQLDKDDFSPLQKYSNIYEPFQIRDYHTFGSPIYVLDRKLQTAGSKMPKWEPRCRLRFYLGRSPYHAGNVSLVLNPRTLHISPQFHVVLMMTSPQLIS